MAIDSRQKRMSAMHPACPWRGILVDAAETGFGTGNRRAALYLYSLEAAAPVTGHSPRAAGRLYRQRLIRALLEEEMSISALANQRRLRRCQEILVNQLARQEREWELEKARIKSDLEKAMYWVLIAEL